MDNDGTDLVLIKGNCGTFAFQKYVWKINSGSE
jgi:hypothetical protein